MTSPLDPGPFYFAWVDEDQTEFDPDTMCRVDEDVFTFTLRHDEGQFATLDLTVKNPRIGLLNAGRKLWAWFSYRKLDDTVVPLFFGQLIAVPADLFAELISLKFNARPEDYIAEKQAVAETMRVRPYWDPVFLDDQHRDDPDAILEGWSALYHIDRVTHEVTASDILEGEDGAITFDQTKGFYDSVHVEMGECPLETVRVTGAVQWTQRCTNILPVPLTVNVQSYTGGSFKDDWPKSGGQLGGGWSCDTSFVTDVNGTDHAKSTSNSSDWQNNDPGSGDCSTESMSVSMTTCNIPGIAVDSTVESQTGVCDPDGGNADGSTGVNIPMKVNANGSLALLWVLNCAMTLRYDAKRDFTEQVVVTLDAHVQETTVAPSIDENTESMQVSGANVGQPLLDVKAWSNFAEAAVGVGQIIFPNNRSEVGGNSYQICVQAGTADEDEPDFSDIPGTITIDGTVHWASLGDSVPTSQPSWTDSTPVPYGEIVLYEPKVWNDTAGSFNTTGQACFLICVGAGTTNSAWTDFTYIPGISSNDDTLQVPVNSAYIPGPNQFSPYIAPITARGQTVVDGSVTWLSLGENPTELQIPIGGSTESVTARSYFCTDRGRWSVEYLICKARARLRLRSRCVKVSWDAPFEDCLDLSLRKNATLLDGRLPGSAATGKITGYSLSSDQEGKVTGHIEIGVTVGFGASIPEITGTPEYTAATGYMQAGYQRFDGGQYSIAEEDVGYTPPVFEPFDDGLAFPLQFFPGVIKLTTPDQVEAVQDALNAQQSPFLSATNVPVFNAGVAGGAGSTLGTGSVGTYMQDINPREYALEATPVTCEIIIKPVQNGPFNGSIAVNTSVLEIPQGINLAADSSG